MAIDTIKPNMEKIFFPCLCMLVYNPIKPMISNSAVTPVRMALPTVRLTPIEDNSALSAGMHAGHLATPAAAPALPNLLNQFVFMRPSRALLQQAFSVAIVTEYAAAFLGLNDFAAFLALLGLSDRVLLANFQMLENGP